MLTGPTSAHVITLTDRAVPLLSNFLCSQTQTPKPRYEKGCPHVAMVCDMSVFAFHSRWFALGVIFLARTSMAMQFQSIAPVAQPVVTDLGITYAQLGLLIGLYFLPGTVLALPGGLLGERFGNRRVVLCALALMTCGGLVTAASNSLWPAGAGRLVSGGGGVLLTLVLSKMTAEWFAGKEIATAMSVMLTGWPLGIGLGTALFGAVAAA